MILDDEKRPEEYNFLKISVVYRTVVFAYSNVLFLYFLKTQILYLKTSVYCKNFRKNKNLEVGKPRNILYVLSFFPCLYRRR